MRLSRLASVVAAVLIASAACGQTATSTALAITSNGNPVTTVKEGTEVILTATVMVSGGAVAAPPGQVNFCDVASAPLKCTDIRLLGTVQLSGTGTAVYRFFPGPGPHSYQATFLGTHVEAASTSSAATLVVSPYYPTTTAISASGGVGNYTLTATVTSSGGTVSPTGTISFLDTSNANYVLGTAPLTPDPASFGLSFGFLSPLLQGVGGSYGIVAADFNGDGIPDLAAGTAVNLMLVMLGNGDGTFTFAPSSPTMPTDAGTSLVAGDFNGDGILDLAVVVGALNSPNGELQVLLGNGDGSFRPRQRFTLPAPNTVVTGDFNGDGIPDLAVVVSSGGTSGAVSILLGNGDGSFALKSNPMAGTNPTAIAVGDFNGDGKTDLAVLDEGASFAPNGVVTVLLGNGDGTFMTSPSGSTTGYGPVGITTGDFNGDGILDLAVANDLGNSVTVLLGKGDGTFTTAPTLTVGTLPNAVYVGDFNGDGKADLITPNGAPAGSNHGTVQVLLGNGDGTFAAPAVEDGGEETYLAAVADFNGDGLDDIATSQGGQTPMLNLVFVDLSQVGAQSAKATVSGISPVGQGSHLVDASYPGDTNYRPSVSPTIPLTALPETTTLTLTANPTSSGYGQQVTLTATLAPLTAQNHSATGSIAFTVGSTMLGSVPIGNGVIVLQTTALPVGTDTVTATYEDDTNFAYATASVTVTVSPYASATTLTAAPNPAGVGQTVTLTGAVTGNGSPAPTGTVTFYDGATQLSQATLDGTGHATYSTATLALGTHALTAVYAGNAIYAPSTSSTASESIQNAGFTMTLSNPSITLQTYQHTTTTVTLTSLGNFTENIGLACGSLPAFVTCIFTPNPAALVGNGTTAVSFYLDTDSILGGASGPLASRREAPSPVSFAWVLTPVGLFAAFGGRRPRRRVSLLVIGLAVALLGFAIDGCGNSVITPVPSTTPGTYTIPITATGATSGVTHTAQLTLAVTP